MPLYFISSSRKSHTHAGTPPDFTWSVISKQLVLGVMFSTVVLRKDNGYKLPFPLAVVQFVAVPACIYIYRTFSATGNEIKWNFLQHTYLQGWAKKWAPGCENFSGNLRQKW